MGDIEIRRKSVSDPKGCHYIKTEKCKVGQVILRKGLVQKVGMDQAQPPERLFAKAEILKIGQEYPSGVADDDVSDSSVSCDKQSDLSVYLL